MGELVDPPHLKCGAERRAGSIPAIATIGRLTEWFMVRAWKARGCNSPTGSNPVPSSLAPCGGIGRRARFKIWCPQGRVGSSPTGGTWTLSWTLCPSSVYLDTFCPDYLSRLKYGEVGEWFMPSPC